MTQIKEIKVEIKRRIEQSKKERNKIPSATPKSLEESDFGIISLGARIAALEEILVFINSLPAEQPSEDLEEAANKYADDNPSLCLENDGGIYEDFAAPRRNFIAGANWQKEQMMRAAIDALVDEDAENVGKKTLLFIGEQRDALNTQLSNYEYGETVKLVVIKEEK